jgi:hypothetical protein
LICHVCESNRRLRSADETWDALLGVKIAEAGTAAAAASGGALCFLLCSIGE